jgi:hypothetical protein
MTLRTLATGHGGSEFTVITEGGVVGDVAMTESVFESRAGPNRTPAVMLSSSTLRTRRELSLICTWLPAPTSREGAQIATRAVAFPNAHRTR